MITSRDINDLLPDVQEKAKEHVRLCKAEGIDLLIYCTYRDYAAQTDLFARGRTVLYEAGHMVKKVTNARAGQSFHNFRRAYDCVPLIHGKPIWDTAGAHAALWERVGKIGESLGLEWAGRWISFKELPHFQLTGGHPVEFYARQVSV